MTCFVIAVGEKPGKPISLGLDGVQVWKKKKKTTIATTEAMSNDLRGTGVHPNISKVSQQALDPSTIHRECPWARCPTHKKCADPTYHCCKTGGFSFCCPAGSQCLNTHPPTCLNESLTDPEACTEEECQPDFHCPLSRVASCCRGGRTCCPVSSKCQNTDPPTCKLISHWEFLNKVVLYDTGCPVHFSDTSTGEQGPAAACQGLLG